jgi:hypothetical protein
MTKTTTSLSMKGIGSRRAAEKLSVITKAKNSGDGRPMTKKGICLAAPTQKKKLPSIPILQPELSRAEQDQFKDCEVTIEKGFETFVEVGEALATIRDSLLYRQTHATFESYCRERWQLGRAHAHRQINAAKVVKSLSPNGDNSLPPGVPLPTFEAQVRPLVGLQANAARTAWVKAARLANGCRVTAKLVEAQIIPKKGKVKSAALTPSTRPKSKIIGRALGILLDRIEKLAASTNAARKLSREITKLRKLLSAERLKKSSGII